jgi:uncharacterized YigZ family protein
VPGAAGTAELREQGSRFLARVEPVADAAAVAAALEAFRRDHRGATHYCWARRLGQPAEERSTDAGEPAGTAGAPMLRVLRGAGLSDVVALVARWFGGVKLGKGGLARAYAGVVRRALEELRIGERLVYETLDLELAYEQLGALRRLVHPPEVVLAQPRYGERVRCTLEVVPPSKPALVAALAALGLSPTDEPVDDG